jgi:thiamine biosynthesis lipoprotein
MQAAAAIVRRARPLLGTLVSVQVRGADEASDAAIEAAFAEIAMIHRLMSAHAQDSELARLAHARAGERVVLHPHTMAVLRLAQTWCRASAGAFDAQRAGERLAALGCRPGLQWVEEGAGRLADVQFEEDAVQVPGPLRLDLGGIAKGYAVDQAVSVLRTRGIHSGLVNAGGDLRAFGPHAWRVDVQHPAVWSRTQRLLRLRDAAVASSVRADSSEFITTRRRPATWRRCTVLARDCASADALTKWALQQPAPSLQLRAALARAGARLWRE